MAQKKSQLKRRGATVNRSLKRTKEISEPTVFETRLARAKETGGIHAWKPVFRSSRARRWNLTAKDRSTPSAELVARLAGGKGRGHLPADVETGNSPSNSSHKNSGSST